MKNPFKGQRNSIKSILFMTLISIAFIFQSCETEIPINDTDSPKFSFKISGENFDHTFTEEDDFQSFNLHLNNNTVYDFVYSAGDAGGLKLMEMIFESDKLLLETTLRSGWTLTDEEDFKHLSWHGDVNNPITGNILTGTFKTPNYNPQTVIYTSTGIYFNTYDFAGEHRNQTFKQLNITIAKQRTEIVSQ